MVKFFDLTQGDFFNGIMIMRIISARCAGHEKDPDTNEDWTCYKNIDISVIRSRYTMPDAIRNHNVVNNLIYEFTVEELAEDYISDECNPDVENMCHHITRLPIGRNSSHFFIKVELE